MLMKVFFYFFLFFIISAIRAAEIGNTVVTVVNQSATFSSEEDFISISVTTDS